MDKLTKDILEKLLKDRLAMQTLNIQGTKETYLLSDLHRARQQTMDWLHELSLFAD